MGLIRALTMAAASLALSIGVACAQAPRPRPVSVEYSFWTPAYALQQQRLMNATLEGIQPQRPGVRDVYILAAGLHGGHVFESEASNGAAALAKHYGAQGRTIVLSNDHHPGPVEFATASPDHLQASLARIAEVMDKEEDVAIIFLTSHGGQGSGIAGFEPIMAGGDTPFRDFAILPGALRGALDSAGIKNRIIILSACFSGQFIPTLQDPRTIVITAASAEKTSFGCQAQRDWTYFGDAFFAQALPQSGGLMSAFERAKATIKGWETAQNLIPSDPQSSLGAQSAKFLADIEKNAPGN